MKENTHPKYQEVLIIDSTNGHKFICASTVQTKETEIFEGKEYPVLRVPISASSHPFWMGGKQIIDTEGRIDKFTKRYQNVQQKAQALAQKEAAVVEPVKPAKKARRAT